MNKLIKNWILSRLGKRYLPKWVILVLDLSIVFFSFLFVVCVLTNFSFHKIFLVARLQILGLLQISYFLSFLLWKSYEGSFRYTGLRDMTRLISSAICASIFAFAISRNVVFSRYFTVDYTRVSFFVLHVFSFIFGALGIRLAVKLFFNYYVLKSRKSHVVGILVYGAGSTGVNVLNAIKDDRLSGYFVVGFIDDNIRLIGKRINGVKVFSFDQVFNHDFILSNRVRDVVWSIQNEEGTSFHKAGDACILHSLSFKKAPNVRDWIGGSLSRKQLRKVHIEDLLNRSAISIDNNSLNVFITNKIILVSGAAGSIGSELCRQILNFQPKQLILFDNGETALNDFIGEIQKIPKFRNNVICIIGDVTRENRVSEVFESYRPELVFHAAAYKHVPMMELNVKEAVRVNVEGTRIMAEASINYGVKKFIFISSDKAVNPTNVMGASKRVAEILIQNMSGKSETEFITTRFGNVLGSNGSVIPLFRRQIENRENVTVTHKDITRYFMTIPEACQLVFQAATMGNGGEIFVFDMGQPIKIYDLAEKMIKLSGLTLNVDIKIVEIGLREGEKLFEELLSDSENTLPTHHPKIMIAKVREYNDALILPLYSNLGYAAFNGATDLEIVKLLKQIVPEYKSQNSVYQVLD